ncbi:MAG: hypothetical protein GY702_07070 [Desulfobulbaceae bacterium]|nr:hypothetical protein [Desulfobulbaceae bacterium]
MLREFIKDAQRFGIKTFFDGECSDEAAIVFDNKKEVQTFFNSTIRDRINCATIQRIAKDVAPSYCRPNKNRLPLSGNDLLENMYEDIYTGKLTVVLKNGGLKVGQKTEKTTKKDDNKNLFEEFDLLKFAEYCARELKKTFSKIFHAEYHILEKVIRVDENTTGVIPVIVDTSTIEFHSTKWKAWDDPFNISALGVFKGAVTFSMANFLNLGRSALAAAAIGGKSELVTGQYLATGKSIICRKWYGSFSLRYNLRSGYWEIPWVKYKKSGPDERKLVEFKRKDRILMHKKVIYEHPEVLIPPFQSMEDYLSNYQKGFVPPEHDVNRPIRVGRFF